MDGSDEGERDEGIGMTRVMGFSVLKGMMVVGGVYVRELDQVHLACRTQFGDL